MSREIELNILHGYSHSPYKYRKMTSDEEETHMKITVSGEAKEVKDGITISELLEQEKVEMPEYVSVSVNEEFAQRSDFDTQKLKDGDVVEFLYFMGGGC